MSQDYYTMLNLTKDCAKNDIESAYRKLAIKYHPDKNKDNIKEAEEKFKNISKAYQILSNDESRNNYDNYGIEQVNGIGKIIDPYLVFKDVFDDEDNDTPNVIININIPMSKLYAGVTETVKFARYSPCIKCDAFGTSTKKNGDCSVCKGSGSVMETIKGGKMGFTMNEKKCSHCNGDGMDPDVKKCKKCDGNKYIKEDIECEIDIPVGAYDKYYIKLENEGNYIPKDEQKNNKTRTDVLFVINETIDPNYSHIRRGMFIKEIGRINRADLIVSITIDYENAILGVKKEIDLFGIKKVGIDIENIIQNGDVYVVKNMGTNVVPEEVKKTGLKYGDLFIVFSVNKPILNEQQKRRIWQIITGKSYPENIYIKDVNKAINLIEYIDEHVDAKQKKYSDSDTDNET